MLFYDLNYNNIFEPNLLRLGSAHLARARFYRGLARSSQAVAFNSSAWLGLI